MKIGIRHDGNPKNAVVVNDETGETVSNVVSYELRRRDASCPLEYLTVEFALTPKLTPAHKETS